MKWLAIFAILAASTFAERALSEAAARHPDPRVETLARQFEAIAFGCEFQSDCSWITKWRGAVRIQTHDMPDAFRPNVENIAARVARYTGMDIKLVRSGGNVHFWFGKDPSTYSSNPAVRCGATISLDQDNSVTQAKIYINHNRVLRFVPGCIIEEFVQSVTALHNDSDEVFEPKSSIFRQSYESADLTPTDIILIRASAHPDLKAGMTKQQAAPIIRRILAGLI